MSLPVLSMPGLPDTVFADAAAVLEENLHYQDALGHKAPFFSPGGMYGPCWWSLDDALALSGYKWIDRAQAETIFLNLAATQLPSGRVMLWGRDQVPHIEIADHQAKVGSLPKFFETGAALCRETNGPAFLSAVYRFFRANLAWWFAARQEARTGLISALFEETFLPYLHGDAYEYAPVDTNILIATACGDTAELARRLGKEDEARSLVSKRNALLDAVNHYLWDEADQVYYPYLLREGKRKKILLASTFSGLAAAVDDRRRIDRLLALMQDDGVFNWASFPLTSAARTDPVFTVTPGTYQGNPSWSGGVWTLLNDSAVRALVAVGERAVAGDLAWKTVRLFSHRYPEFLDPRDGSEHGVLRYAWTAGQVLRLLIEGIFGVVYDGITGDCRLEPLPVAALAGKHATLTGLRLPDGNTINVELTYGMDGTPTARRR